MIRGSYTWWIVEGCFIAIWIPSNSWRLSFGRLFLVQGAVPWGQLIYSLGPLREEWHFKRYFQLNENSNKLMSFRGQTCVKWSKEQHRLVRGTCCFWRNRYATFYVLPDVLLLLLSVSWMFYSGESLVKAACFLLGCKLLHYLHYFFCLLHGTCLGSSCSEINEGRQSVQPPTIISAETWQNKTDISFSRNINMELVSTS